MSKIKRFFYQVVRLFKFLPCILENDWDFELGYLLYLELKLQHVFKVLDKSRKYVGVERDLQKIQVVLEHIKRYNDLTNCEHKCRKEPEGYETWLMDWSEERHKNPKEKYYRYWLNQNYKLEQYHWNEIHKYIYKYSQKWWD